jgi:hypothetical protein
MWPQQALTPETATNGREVRRIPVMMIKKWAAALLLWPFPGPVLAADTYTGTVSRQGVAFNESGQPNAVILGPSEHAPKHFWTNEYTLTWNPAETGRTNGGTQPRLASRSQDAHGGAEEGKRPDRTDARTALRPPRTATGAAR